MMQEYLLRRHMAETPSFFDLRRTQWRQAQRKRCPQQARNSQGRFIQEIGHG